MISLNLIPRLFRAKAHISASYISALKDGVMKMGFLSARADSFQD